MNIHIRALLLPPLLHVFVLKCLTLQGGVWGQVPARALIVKQWGVTYTVKGLLFFLSAILAFSWGKAWVLGAQEKLQECNPNLSDVNYTGW